MSPTLAATTLLPLPSLRHSFSLPLSLSSLSTAPGPPDLLLPLRSPDRSPSFPVPSPPPRRRDAMEPPHAEQAVAAVAAGGEGGTASPDTGLEGPLLSAGAGRRWGRGGRGAGGGAGGGRTATGAAWRGGLWLLPPHGYRTGLARRLRLSLVASWGTVTARCSAKMSSEIQSAVHDVVSARQGRS
ncbi:DEAD-box ATP-dependent RNA helicase 30 isoform X3 [Zea mays]|nr:DEAD-box ATP-dependent RNA helicase 30 isoform X3 [Zea mays]